MSTDPNTDHPFAGLLRAASLFHHDAWPGHINEFREIGQGPEDQLAEYPARVKHELRQALNGHDDDLDYDELWQRSSIYLGSDSRFLRLMWVSFFPHEPIPGPPHEPFDAALTIGELYYANAADPDDNVGHPTHLKTHLALPPAEQGPLLRTLKTDLALIIADATDQMPTGGLRRHVFRVPEVRGDHGIARALWHDLFPDDPIPGEEQHGPAGQRPELWPHTTPSP